MNHGRSTVLHTLAACSALTLIAATGRAIDDRDNSSPTSWQWRYGKTATEVNALVAAGYRVVDVEVESASPHRFSVALVRNTGSHQKTGWWTYDKTEAQLKALYRARGARLTDLERYTVNGRTRFAAVMIRNSGADAATWWWSYGKSEAELKSLYNSRGARLIDLELYSVNGAARFAAVMVRNTGRHARTWWWNWGKSEAELKALYRARKARLQDLETYTVNGATKFAAVMVRNTGSSAVAWWWHYGKTEAEVNKLWRQYGARIIDIQRRGTGAATRFSVVFLNNSNALTTRVGGQLRGAIDGCRGIYLKRVSGSTLASLMPDFEFEPASTMKTLHHVHAMRRVRLGQDRLTNRMTVFMGSNGSCPNGTQPVSQTLRQSLRAMMENSSNQHTMAIESRYGRANIQATAAALGMSRTRIRHRIGCFCAFQPSQLTLRDIGRLHEAVANGYLGAQRETFIDLMLNSVTNFPGFGTPRLGTVIAQEAARVGLSASERQAFTAAMRMAYKAGRYTCGSNRWQTITGWLRLPFVSKGKLAPREYVLGSFAHRATRETRDAIAQAATELVRDEIRAAMTTFKGVTFGSFTKFGSSCRGSAGTPTHSAFGCPTIGEIASFKVFAAPRRQPGSLILGASNRFWGLTRLPVELGAYGGPGCHLRVSPNVFLPVVVGDNGTATVPLRIPRNTSMIGKHIYTQYVVRDPRANRLGAVLTNGYDTLIGGK